MRGPLRLIAIAAAGSIALGLAPAALAHGPFHELIAAANERVARDPGNADALIARGELHRVHGDFDAALDDFGRAARLQPGNDGIDLLRGRALAEARRPLMAKSHLDRFLARHPDDAAALVERARVHEALGDRRAAAEDHDQAIARMAKPGPDDYVARMKAQIAAGQAEAALRGLDDGIRRLGSIVALEQPAIELELAAQRWDAALARLDRLAAQSARKESFHAQRGAILLKAGRRQEARQSFRAGLEALATLPPHLRGTRAMIELRAKLQRELRALEAPPGGQRRRPKSRRSMRKRLMKSRYRISAPCRAFLVCASPPSTVAPSSLSFAVS